MPCKSYIALSLFARSIGRLLFPKSPASGLPLSSLFRRRTLRRFGNLMNVGCRHKYVGFRLSTAEGGARTIWYATFLDLQTPEEFGAIALLRFNLCP